jgi:ribosome-associated toxin RatA of RatAB toxin-antitoxin module
MVHKVGNVSSVAITITQLNSARNKGIKKSPFKRPHNKWQIFVQWERKTKIDMVEISFRYKVMIYVTILITERANGKIVN